MKHINAKDLVAYALAAVGEGYCWGAGGEVCSLSFREELARRAPDQKTNLLGVCAKWDGKRVQDCSGLFRGAWRALWQYKSGGATGIWNTWCTGAKGTIDTLPQGVPGVALFVQSKTNPASMSHIGLTVGNGMAVDANGSRTGVLHRPVSAHPWTHWAYLDDVDYENAMATVDELPALYSGTVRTRTGSGISLWTDNTKKVAVAKVPDGATVDVLGDADAKGFAAARYGGRTGVADLQYIIHDEGEAPSQDTYRAVVTGVRTGLNLYTQPVKDAKKYGILLIPNGGVVEVFPEMRNGEFAYVLYLGHSGYCTESYLRRMAEEVAV